MSVMTAKGAEMVELGGLFDALGDDARIELAGDGKDKLDHVSAAAIGLHVGDQRAIDFEDVGGDVAESGKGEGGCAEAVEGSDDIETLELRERCGREVGVGHGDRLGNA